MRSSVSWVFWHFSAAFFFNVKKPNPQRPSDIQRGPELCAPSWLMARISTIEKIKENLFLAR